MFFVRVFFASVLIAFGLITTCGAFALRIGVRLFLHPKRSALPQYNLYKPDLITHQVLSLPLRAGLKLLRA